MRKLTPFVAAIIAALILFSALLAQTVLTGVVLKNANLRSGPGTSYALAGTVKAGQVIKIVGKTDDGSWYHLDSSQWIGAFLVKITSTITTTTTPGVTATATKAASAKPAGTATPAATATKAASKAAPTATQTPGAAAPTAVATNCDPSYPDFCIPPLPAKLTCKDIGRNNFTVLAPDPRRLDRDHDGIGCEK